MKRRVGSEQIVFVIGIVTLAALVAWWLVFARNLSTAHYEMNRKVLSLTVTDPMQLQARIGELDERFTHRLFMIAAEGASFAALLLLCTATLFLVARKRAQTNERMERVLQFTTHELKTPIAGVKALLQSLALGSLPPESQAQFLDQGVAECNRLEHLTESILAYQRAFATEHANVVSAHGKRIVEEVLEHRRGTHGREEITLRVDDARVLVDRDAFRVVFENLLDNARKYGGGKPVEISARVHAGAWVVAVRDRGIGFRPEQAEGLFDPFTREARSETVKTHGSGLGLYISRQLANRFGARLTAESEGPGKGAAFLLALRTES